LEEKIMMPSGQELLVIVFVIVLLFGAKKIPELAAGVGKGIREFKKASRGDYDEVDKNEKEKDEE
jgi:sec-independent protein translocase protein TatA